MPGRPSWTAVLEPTVWVHNFSIDQPSVLENALIEEAFVVYETPGTILLVVLPIAPVLVSICVNICPEAVSDPGILNHHSFITADRVLEEFERHVRHIVIISFYIRVSPFKCTDLFGFFL